MEGAESCRHAVLANRGSSLYGDQPVTIADLGNEATTPVVVAVAKTLPDALVPDGNDHSNNLQFNEMLRAMMRQRGDQPTDNADIQ